MGPTSLTFFLGICRNLKSIVVQIGIADYFKEPSSPEAQKLFEDMITKLQVSSWLGSRPPGHPAALVTWVFEGGLPLVCPNGN